MILAVLIATLTIAFTVYLLAEYRARKRNLGELPKDWGVKWC